MDRPKQQAIMFLLGAILVGGVLGFSADRFIGRGPRHGWPQRTNMYDDIGATDKQRVSLDSLFDDAQCHIEILLRPVQPSLDSIHKNARLQMRALMTPEQRAKLDARVSADSARRASRPGPRSPRPESCKK